MWLLAKWKAAHCSLVPRSVDGCHGSCYCGRHVLGGSIREAQGLKHTDNRLKEQLLCLVADRRHFNRINISTSEGNISKKIPASTTRKRTVGFFFQQSSISPRSRTREKDYHILHKIASWNSLQKRWINTKCSQSCCPITLSLSLQTYLVIIEQLGSQQSSLWSDAAAQRAHCNLYHVEVCKGWHPPGLLVPPISPCLALIFFSPFWPSPSHFHIPAACVSAVNNTFNSGTLPASCQISRIHSQHKCLDRRETEVHFSQKRSPAQNKHMVIRGSKTKYLDQYQPIARAVSSLIRDLVSHRQEHLLS